MKRNQVQRGRNAAFTLIEILIAMTIFALISGSILAILAQAGTAAADLRDTDQKEEEISRFVSLLRQTIETLPADAKVEMVPASESASGFAEMKISNAMGAFLFGEDIGSAGELTIGLQPQDEAENQGQEGQFYQLAISRDSFAPKDTDGSGMVFGAGGEDFLTPDSEGRYWLPLVSHVLSASWRYFDEQNGEWLEEWTEQNLPPLMEFVIDDNYHAAAVRTVFEMPDHLVNGAASTTAPNSTDTGPNNVTSATTGVSQQPGGAGGGNAGNGGGRPGDGGNGDRGRGGAGRDGGRGSGNNGRPGGDRGPGNNGGGPPAGDGGGAPGPR